MRRTWIVATLALALAVSACGGGSTSSSSAKTAPSVATATTPPPVSPTAVPPTPVPVPDRPATITGYAAAIASYLSASPAASSNCLADVFAAWKMPLVTSANGCRSANTDADPDKEVVVVLTAKLAAPTALSDTQFEVAAFKAVGTAYGVAFQSPLADLVPPGATAPVDILIDAGDLLGTGLGAFAYKTTSCGASTCTDTVHIYRGIASGYVSLTPPGGISMTSASITFKDIDGDGVDELLMTGGTAGSAGAGPQRPRMETWKFSGAQFALTDTTPAKPDYLYHAVKDADALFVAGDYARAEPAYIAAVNDKQLKIWMDGKNERNELESYALFRAALSVLASGRDLVKARAYLDTAKAYPNTLHAQLAASFEAAYAAKSSVAVGCGAVRDDLGANASEYQAFWDFGYSNPQFDPAIVCPF